ncbi:aspartyl/glutamyl-tRNA(Asn/Gln) amidotransferase subunit C [Coriobacterium glomerans PW2]|uniref:Aspartyl/glutamyl-tRNA(Asn/Gln) amidotransferase subunit C n=1 Tax=Coriobacterium glomerans (strain ATCC 49209 / DSM 20642 / JCM 10262 / PW2) TaxID=700015 RepID=F2NAT1_CORGP|nr:Asp-tRNA(Asn)/Glu-tRNA(Gln) amidotransferase subunit GatC [Coriobacterium glomerans]AEB07537.1 aspartyl/glutamyl-tRNA(Asn/Gln) amidotransferase subunit C [Coriobacterium glomerans PW2]
MAFSVKDVQDISGYVCIDLDRDELVEMRDYLNEAIDLLEPILEYDTSDVEPTFYPIGDLSNVVREDAIASARSLSIEEALANAASTRGRSFLIPQILGGEQDR